MKKMILTIIILSILKTFAFADLYAVIDKETAEVKGVTEIDKDYISDWAKTYILKKADESFKGKQGYEIKFEQGKIRHATKAEIDAYKLEKEQEAEAKKKQDAMNILGLTQTDIDKLKNLP